MTNKVLQEHLNEFISLKNEYSQLAGFEDLDPYAFKINFKAGGTHLMIFALTHGNEVIGLPILNQFLRKSLVSKTHNFAVMLNNLNAFFEEKRYLESDLNRCFSSNTTLSNITNRTSEQRRALEIQSLINKVRPLYILDLHQTVEASESVFAIIPEDANLIRLSDKFSSEIPIVCFANTGFSKAGMTLIEYAKSIGIPALVYELGQKGLNTELSLQFADKIYQFNLLIRRNQVDFEPKTIDYYRIIEDIPHEIGQSLKDGFKSFQKLEINQVLTQNNSSKSTAEFINRHENSVIIFPRYKEKKQDEELGLIATKRQLNKDSL